MDPNRQAGEWMHRGIALLQSRDREQLREAIHCFDQAIELRRQLPLGENPEFRYALAAGLINRGEALSMLGDAENAAEAVKSHSEAIELLQLLPPDGNALHLKRLAIAWINRGVALEIQGDAPALAEAVSSFQKAIDLLENSPHAADPQFAFVMAGARINHGNTLLRSSGDSAAPAACESAEKALSLLAGSDPRDQAAAGAGFKARHVLCRSLVAMLAAAPPGDESTRLDLTGRITDAVEEGLRMQRDWEKAGVTAFRPLATQLFQVGTLVYERSQPQFLADFLLDYLDPERPTCIVPVDKAWLAFADESLARVRGQFPVSDFQFLATEEGRRGLEILARLTAAREKLKAPG